MGSFAVSWHRRTAWTSLIVLAAALAMPMLPGLHTLARAEADCAGVSRAGADAAIETNAATPAGPDHCVMCHWLRAAQTATVHPAPSADPALTSAPVTVHPVVCVADRLIALEGPSRAPPRVI